MHHRSDQHFGVVDPPPVAHHDNKQLPSATNSTRRATRTYHRTTFKPLLTLIFALIVACTTLVFFLAFERVPCAVPFDAISDPAVAGVLRVSSCNESGVQLEIDLDALADDVRMTTLTAKTATGAMTPASKNVGSAAVAAASALETFDAVARATEMVAPIRDAFVAGAMPGSDDPLALLQRRRQQKRRLADEQDTAASVRAPFRYAWLEALRSKFRELFELFTDEHRRSSRAAYRDHTRAAAAACTPLSVPSGYAIIAAHQSSSAVVAVGNDDPRAMTTSSAGGAVVRLWRSFTVCGDEPLDSSLSALDLWVGAAAGETSVEPRTPLPSFEPSGASPAMPSTPVEALSWLVSTTDAHPAIVTLPGTAAAVVGLALSASSLALSVRRAEAAANVTRAESSSSSLSTLVGIVDAEPAMIRAHIRTLGEQGTRDPEATARRGDGWEAFATFHSWPGLPQAAVVFARFVAGRAVLCTTAGGDAPQGKRPSPSVRLAARQEGTPRRRPRNPFQPSTFVIDGDHQHGPLVAHWPLPVARLDNLSNVTPHDGDSPTLPTSTATASSATTAREGGMPVEVTSIAELERHLRFDTADNSQRVAPPTVVIADSSAWLESGAAGLPRDRFVTQAMNLHAVVEFILAPDGAANRRDAIVVLRPSDTAGATELTAFALRPLCDALAMPRPLLRIDHLSCSAVAGPWGNDGGSPPTQSQCVPLVANFVKACAEGGSDAGETSTMGRWLANAAARPRDAEVEDTRSPQRPIPSACAFLLRQQRGGNRRQQTSEPSLWSAWEERGPTLLRPTAPVALQLRGSQPIMRDGGGTVAGAIPAAREGAGAIPRIIAALDAPMSTEDAVSAVLTWTAYSIAAAVGCLLLRGIARNLCRRPAHRRGAHGAATRRA